MKIMNKSLGMDLFKIKSYKMKNDSINKEARLGQRLWLSWQRSLPIPEVRGSNPVTGEFWHRNLCTYCQQYWKDENKRKEVGNGIFLRGVIELSDIRLSCLKCFHVFMIDRCACLPTYMTSQQQQQQQPLLHHFNICKFSRLDIISRSHHITA